MTDFVKYFVENDPLKRAVDLIDSANFGDKKNNVEGTISISLLFWTTVFIALTKTLYGDGGFTFLQHFWTSIFIVFVMYISVGIIMKVTTHNIDYLVVNNIIRCFLTCFIVSLVVSLIFVFSADFVTRSSVSLFRSIGVSDWYAGRLADLVPAFLFSLIGTAAVFWNKRERHEHSTKQTRLVRIRYWARSFPIYYIITSIVFYALAYDRGPFFDNVMQYSFKLIPDNAGH